MKIARILSGTEIKEAAATRTVAVADLTEYVQAIEEMVAQSVDGRGGGTFELDEGETPRSLVRRFNLASRQVNGPKLKRTKNPGKDENGNVYDPSQYVRIEFVRTRGSNSANGTVTAKRTWSQYSKQYQQRLLNNDPALAAKLQAEEATSEKVKVPA